MGIAKYFRKGKVIRHADGDIECKTINEAKRKSRELQLATDGAIGRGSLIVVKRLPLFAVLKEASA